MPQAPTVKAPILAALREMGPMTAAELADFTGIERWRVDGALHRIRKAGKPPVYIKDWIPLRGRQGSPAAVYALGRLRDTPKPESDTIEARRERQARYRERHRAEINARARAKRGSTLVASNNPFAQLVTVAGASIVATRARRVESGHAQEPRNNARSTSRHVGCRGAA